MSIPIKIYTKDELKEALIAIRAKGFIDNARHGNSGGIGNTLEDELGIPENNFALANSGEWELKAQRIGEKSLTTLFHSDPSPKGAVLVATQLLPFYGWPHAKAGITLPANEKSFRVTINAQGSHKRGFKVNIDEQHEKIVVSFDASAVAPQYAGWLRRIEEQVGLGELNPQPYWGFTDLFHKAGSKLYNCAYIEAQVQRSAGKERYHYTNILMLQEFSLDKFLEGLRLGFVQIDFDARTGKNHGTKFRIKRNLLPNLYKYTEIV